MQAESDASRTRRSEGASQPVYRLRPPCPGRLMLTRWAAVTLVFPAVWLSRVLLGLVKWPIARGATRMVRKDTRSREVWLRVCRAHRRSLRWWRVASGWDGPESQDVSARSLSTPVANSDE